MCRPLVCASLLLPLPAAAAGDPRSVGTPPLLDPSAAAPPVAQTRPYSRTVHGETLTDPYFWLREKGTPEVETYLKAEAAYADAMMEKTKPL